MPKIDALYAWVAEEREGDEGVMAMSTTLGMTPMVGADEARIESYRKDVQSLVDQTGIAIRLVRFVAREELEVIAPTPGSRN